MSMNLLIQKIIEIVKIKKIDNVIDIPKMMISNGTKQLKDAIVNLQQLTTKT